MPKPLYNVEGPRQWVEQNVLNGVPDLIDTPAGSGGEEVVDASGVDVASALAEVSGQEPGDGGATVDDVLNGDASIDDVKKDDLVQAIQAYNAEHPDLEPVPHSGTKAELLELLRGALDS